VAILAVLPSCSTTSDHLDRAAVDEQTIVLQVAVFDAMGVRPLIREWERAHAGVIVELVGDDWIAQNEQLISGFGSRTPDVVTVEGAFAERAYSEPDRFYDLSQYGAERLSADFLPWRWDQGVHDRSGRVLGIPTDVGGMAIAYRVDLFAEAGLPTEPDEVSALWPDWESYLDVGNRFQSSTGMAWIDHPSWLWAAVAYQSPGQFDHRLASGRFVPGSGIRRAWEVAAASTDLSAEVLVMGEGAFSPADPTRQFATTVAPAWLTTHIKESAPEAEGLWALAHVPGRSGNWGGSQLSIPAASEHPQLAWDLISFLSTASSQLEILKEQGNFPSRSDLYNVGSVAEMTDPFFNDAPAVQIYGESVKGVNRVTRTLYDQPIREAFDLAISQILSGDMTKTTAWRFALVEAERRIAELNA